MDSSSYPQRRGYSAGKGKRGFSSLFHDYKQEEQQAQLGYELRRKLRVQVISPIRRKRKLRHKNPNPLIF
jgi:hypothetical protein